VKVFERLVVFGGGEKCLPAFNCYDVLLGADMRRRGQSVYSSRHVEIVVTDNKKMASA
jgi:hypothetical protein